MQFDRFNVTVTLIAAVLVVIVLTIGLVKANARTDAKREAIHRAGVEACQTLGAESARAACLVALDE